MTLCTVARQRCAITRGSWFCRMGRAQNWHYFMARFTNVCREDDNERCTRAA